jgi:hypothetical protein
MFLCSFNDNLPAEFMISLVCSTEMFGHYFLRGSRSFKHSPLAAHTGNPIATPTDGSTPRWAYWLLLERLLHHGFDVIGTTAYTLSSHSLREPNKLDTRGNVHIPRRRPITSSAELAHRILDSAGRMGTGVVMQHSDIPSDCVVTLLLTSERKCLGVA